ncbi:MAG: DinB family protein [Acidobacteriota bacterium]
MKRVLPVLLMAAATPVLAQGMKAASSGGAAGMLHGSYTYVEGYIAKAAEQVPEADYAFKPTPEVRSFGQIVAHVADTQYGICSDVLGEPNPSPDVEKTKTTKAAIVEALKGSSALCQKAYRLPDAEVHGTVKLFGHEMPKFNALLINLTHDWEHYGNIVTYMRLKGMVPPSSQPASK